MSRAAAHFWRMVEPVAVAAGSENPPRDARVLVAMLDGLVADYLMRDPSDPDVLAAGMRRLFS